MAIFRRLVSLCLVVTLVATSGAMAALRDSSDGAQRLVICTGMGPQTVLIGLDGEEVDLAPICPDCTLVLAAGPVPLPARDLPLANQAAYVLRAAAQDIALAPGLRQRPRAPPA